MVHNLRPNGKGKDKGSEKGVASPGYKVVGCTRSLFRRASVIWANGASTNTLPRIKALIGGCSTTSRIQARRNGTIAKGKDAQINAALATEYVPSVEPSPIIDEDTVKVPCVCQSNAVKSGTSVVFTCATAETDRDARYAVRRTNSTRICCLRKQKTTSLCTTLSKN